MKKSEYYSSGEFARKARVTQRAIRYYDKHDILKPTLVTESGTRFYTDEDFARLQQILLLKYLGFSLADIRQMTINDADYHYLASSLRIQRKLIQDKIEQMQLVEKAIEDTSSAIEENHDIDWEKMLDLIHLTGMEKSLKNQYQDASNISSRINLHQLYSQNPQGWFQWIYEQCDISDNMRILEIGCGDGSFWTINADKLPSNIHIILSDISEGMIRDARREIGSTDGRYSFANFDCHKIPYPQNSFDLVIANHVLFYCMDISTVFEEVYRVLKPGGHFICSTYSEKHMAEISQLVTDFDDRIVLSADKLYEQFGLDNGAEQLRHHFKETELRRYQDELIVPDADPLISYILSCHGNQNQYIISNYKDFRTHVSKKIKRGFHITKDAGIFLGQK